MGAWNTSLYGNDTARDVKGDYVHKLRSGKNDQEAMEAMLVEYERTKDDEDEGPLFWLALADTQWEYDILPRKPLFAAGRAGKPIGKHVAQGPRALVELIWADSFSRRLR